MSDAEQERIISQLEIPDLNTLHQQFEEFNRASGRYQEWASAAPTPALAPELSSISAFSLSCTSSFRSGLQLDISFSRTQASIISVQQLVDLAWEAFTASVSGYRP